METAKYANVAMNCKVDNQGFSYNEKGGGGPLLGERGGITKKEALRMD